MNSEATQRATDTNVRGLGRPMADPGRMCVVCRRKAAMEEFVQLKLTGLDAPPTSGRSGRGAYVCIALACLKQVQQKTLERALKTTVPNVPEGPELLVHLRGMAEKQVLNLLGLARRCGVLVCGVEQVERYLPEGGGFFVMAADLARRSAAKLREVEGFLEGERLGRAVGIGFVGAMGIRPGRLARQAAYWLRLWYETDSRPRPAEQDKLDGCADDGESRDCGQGHQLEKPVEVA